MADRRVIRLDEEPGDRRVIVLSAEWKNATQDDFEQPCPGCKLDVKLLRIPSYHVLTDRVCCPLCRWEGGGEY